MPSTTSRLALTEPVGADAASEFRVAITNNATILDNAVTFSEGTLVSRPAAALAGRVYYATDVNGGTYYLDNGSAWLLMLLAGAWTALTLGAGITADSGTRLPSARLEGDVVRLRGGLANSSGGTIASFATLATLPAGEWPSVRAGVAVVGVDTSGAIVGIATSGVLTTGSAIPNGYTLFLDEIAFSLT